MGFVHTRKLSIVSFSIVMSYVQSISNAIYVYHVNGSECQMRQSQL